MREEQPDLVVVDVREPFEWDEGHIEGAVHLPMGEAVRRMTELPAGSPEGGRLRGRACARAGDQRAEPCRA